MFELKADVTFIPRGSLHFYTQNLSTIRWLKIQTNVHTEENSKKTFRTTLWFQYFELAIGFRDNAKFSTTRPRVLISHELVTILFNVQL